MIPVSVDQASQQIGVAPVGAGEARVAITALVADSRAVTSGALFVALRGARADGHDFVARARADGASAVLVSRPVDGGLSVVVPDPLTALGSLARDQVAAGRSQGRVPHVGSRQVRSQTPCVRRHEPHSAEQSIAADRHPCDLRTEWRRFRNVHG